MPTRLLASMLPGRPLARTLLKPPCSALLAVQLCCTAAKALPDHAPSPPPAACHLQIYSPKSIPSFFTTPDASMWAAVRKGCMPAFSADNMRKAFPVVRCAVSACLQTQVQTNSVPGMLRGLACHQPCHLCAVLLSAPVCPLYCWHVLGACRDAVQEVGDHLEAQAALPAGKQGLDMQVGAPPSPQPLLAP